MTRKVSKVRRKAWKAPLSGPTVTTAEGRRVERGTIRNFIIFLKGMHTEGAGAATAALPGEEEGADVAAVAGGCVGDPAMGMPANGKGQS
jgi:hypothetical protein